MKEVLSSYFKAFTSSEKNAGLVLIVCTILSLIASNSALSGPYLHFWHTLAGFSVCGIDMHLSVEHWINDGLMTVFFLMVGLEIRRELLHGELHPLRKAILPLGGAIGGMLLPAIIYTLVTNGTGTENGFGIPMGTDIAFALAVLAIAGERVPLNIRVILTAIAIVDDLGSVLVIALFYGSSINVACLLAALGIFALLLLLNKLRVFSVLLFTVLGLLMWFCMMRSGIHPTLAGVMLAFAIPSGDASGHAPSLRLQHALHLPVAYIILPLFTLANTAIPLKAEFVSGLSEPHALGILLGLLLGKPLGISLAIWLLAKLNLSAVQEGTRWYDIISMGCVAGIGFTMSVFITQLAFSDERLIQSSKMMILIASCTAGLIGLLLFRLRPVKNK